MTFIIASGCGPRPYPESPAVAMYYAGDAEQAFGVQKARLEGLKPGRKGARNLDWTLEAMRLASCAIASSRFADAETLIETCVGIIDEFGLDKRSEKAAGKFGEEANAPFKGYPYERSMVCLYHGLLRYQRQDYQNALPAFRKALSEDWVGADDEFVGDWVLPYVMQMRCLYLLGRDAEAENEMKFAVKFAKRQGYEGQRPYIDPTALKTNKLAIVVEVGDSPAKQREGRRGETIALIRRPGTVNRVTFQINDGSPVELPEVDNVYYQATTRGERQFDKVLKGQVAFKESTEVVANVALHVAALSDDRGVQAIALTVAFFSWIFSASTRPEADYRHWETLPDRIHYASADVEPGSAQVAVRFYNDGGELLTWRRDIRVEIPDDRAVDRLVWVRALPNRAGRDALTTPVADPVASIPADPVASISGPSDSLSIGDSVPDSEESYPPEE
ncbi:MAG: hypothetical protein ABIH86_00770 [Planctomycetota bacterium]